VEGVPKNVEGLPQLVKRIYRPEITHYGPHFEIHTKFDANNIAYTGAAIGLHIDLPFYEKTPSVSKFEKFVTYK
jgi:hypothetical protein